MRSNVTEFEQKNNGQKRKSSSGNLKTVVYCGVFSFVVRRATIQLDAERAGTPALTTWLLGVAAPSNFLSSCVKPLSLAILMVD